MGISYILYQSFPSLRIQISQLDKLFAYLKNSEGAFNLNKNEFDISKIIPTVVKLKCYTSGEDTPFTEGSGFSSVDSSGSPSIFTNAHVVRDDNSVLLDYCLVYFPKTDGSSTYDSVYLASVISPYDLTLVTMSEENVYGVDFAILKITDFLEKAASPSAEFTKFTGTLPDALAISSKSCDYEGEISIGQRIYVLGYPTIGGENVTVTEGIISGFEGQLNQFIKTSAKLSFGSSGGLAITYDKGCLVGIPTLVSSDSVENIGQVLSFSFIKNFFKAIPRLPD
jgi:S1-C subfamily serine protease